MHKMELSQTQIADLALSKGLTQDQIAKLAGCSQQRISQLLRDVKTDPQTIAFRDNKADILESLQGKIINNISDDDLKKASLQQKIISSSVLQDKIQQIRGVATSLSDNQINILVNNVINNYVAPDKPQVEQDQDMPQDISNMIPSTGNAYVST